LPAWRDRLTGESAAANCYDGPAGIFGLTWLLRRRVILRLNTNREEPVMLKPVKVDLSELYIPVKRRNEIDAEKVAALAEEILEEGQKVPIQVRRDKKRTFVVVNGAHRIEAVRLLGEAEIDAFIVGEGKF
jgi:sulfiredoxin